MKEKKDTTLPDNSNTVDLPPALPVSKRKRAFLRLRRSVFKHVWVVRMAFILLVIGAIAATFAVANLVLSKTTFGSYLNLADDFLFPNIEKLAVSENRVNVLILGKGGQMHETPDITDTIIFASVKITDPNEVDLLSLPRDIWLKPLRTKLNTAYYYGNQKQEGGGLILAKSTVEEIVGKPVHYGLVIDFEGFKGVIDALGGVAVNVETAFVDDRYPIPGKENDECSGDPEFLCRYETVRFASGQIHMDGETALKFARSRNAEGDEGTDLARAKRQQLVLLAIKEKMLSQDVLLSPRKLFRVLDVLRESYETDLTDEQLATLAGVGLKARASVTSHVLAEELIYNPPPSYLYDNLYVFIPTADSGGWEEIQSWVNDLLSPPSRNPVGS